MWKKRRGPVFLSDCVVLKRLLCIPQSQTSRTMESSVAQADSAILRQIALGDPTGWSDLVRRYSPILWRFVYAKCEDTHLAEDIVAETMIAFVRELDGSSEWRGNVSAWLTRVARHKLADYWRHKARGQRLVERLQLAQQADATSSTNQNDTVAETLASMDSNERVVLEWKYLSPYPFGRLPSDWARQKKPLPRCCIERESPFEESIRSLKRRCPNEKVES